ncbi:MAG TPA: MFS transporter [Candidatus Saccharibacteria bacterium]|jgi:DHA1 family tetracycline resistance protein-like MFS transporter|nr:MFS transporter [Candidatus Saccharibacteria bacterium]
MEQTEKSKSSRALPAALFTVFLDAIGVAILIPVFVALVVGEHRVIPDTWTMKQGLIMVGWLSGLYSICTFFAAPVLGQLSDKHGRKIVLAISLTGTAIGYAIFAYGILQKNIPILFLGRIIDGLTGGNIAVARAVIGDVSTAQNRTRNYGLIGAMFGIGFVLGPYLGGRLSAPGVPFINAFGFHALTTPDWFQPATPFWFAAIIALINVALVLFVLPETLHKKSEKEVIWTKSFRDIVRAVELPGIRTVLPVTFLYSGGFTFFTTFFSFSMISRIPNFTPANVADYFSLIGIWIAVFQGALIPVVAKKLKNYQVLRFSLFGAALSVLIILSVTSFSGALIVSPLIPLFVALSMANMIALVSSVSEPGIRGEVMGIYSSVEALAQGIPAVISGYIASIAVWMPSVIAATLMVLAGLIFWATFRPSMIKH